MYQFFESDIFGIAAGTANWIATGLAVLLALILLYMLYRLISRPRLASGRRSKHARLAITDAASVDERRKLVLVRRDDVEHLILIGGTNDLVIEADIRKNAPARSITPPAAQPTPAPQPTAPVPAPTPAPAAPVTAAPVAAASPVQPPVTAAPPPAPLAMPAVNAPSQPAASGATTAPTVSVAAPVAAVGAAIAATTTSTPAAAEPTPEVKPEQGPSISDDMDALLTEITNTKS